MTFQSLPYEPRRHRGIVNRSTGALTMPKGSIRNPGTKKTDAARKRARQDKASAEWDLYRGAGYVGRETSGKGMSFTPSTPKTPKRTIRPSMSAKKGSK